MGYLLLAILCSASIALIFKHSESSGMNRYAVTSANYLTAVAVSLILLGFRGIGRTSAKSAMDASFSEIGQALGSGRGIGSSESAMLWALLVGALAGGVFFLAFVYYQVSVREYGAGLSGAFAKLGILVPMSLSLIFWREYPTAVQWAGIGLAVGSILLANRPPQRQGKATFRTALLLLFLFGGLAEFSNKVFQKYGMQEHKALFLLVVFAVAFVCSLAVVMYRRQPVRRRDLITGVAVGIPNLFSSYFLILALDSIPAAVAFPIFGASTVLIINAVGIGFFGERLSGSEKAAIVLTIVALVLVNL